jgi:mono/diheme cytochrome c family protein
VNFKRLNLVLSVLLALVVGFTLTARRDLSQPNWQFLTAMKHSPANQAFEVSAEFPNGRTQQPPVNGAIARGDLPLHYAATKEDAIRAGEELINPYQQSAPTTATADPATDPQAPFRDSIARGAELFQRYCVACHGAGGTGNGAVAQRGFPPPPSLVTGNSTRMKDGQLFHILTYGQGSMPGMEPQLTRDRRWDVINFVRTLQVPGEEAEQPAGPVDVTADDAPDSPASPADTNDIEAGPDDSPPDNAENPP